VTIERMIDMLKGLPTDAKVLAFDADSGQMEEVTGCVIFNTEGTVELCTDED
jgi:hypothetical protein